MKILKEDDFQQFVANSLYKAAGFHAADENYPGIQKLSEKITKSHHQAIKRAELEATANTLQWVDDLGREATKGCSIHNMNEYWQKYGEGVSHKVHTRLLDEALPALEASPNTEKEE